MKRKSVHYLLLRNYVIMILLTTMVTFAGILFMCETNTLYDEDSPYVQLSAPNLMLDDYTMIDTSMLEYYGGGLQVISPEYQVLYSKGNRIFQQDQITPDEFASYLVHTEQKNEIVSVDYNETKGFWLITSLPIGMKCYFSFDMNRKNPITQETFQTIRILLICYLSILLVSILIYTRITSRNFVQPLKELCKSVERFKNGDYSVRAREKGNQEFVELQSAFNRMAEEVQTQIQQKELSEENRKKLMRDISHDLKNPLMSIIGYAGMIAEESEKSNIEQYAEIVCTNGMRANELVKDLFELSSMESPQYVINCVRKDFTEYFRNEIILILPELEKAKIEVNIDIPEEEVIYEFDPRGMRRVISNLLYNAISYCGNKGQMDIRMEIEQEQIRITFSNSVSPQKPREESYKTNEYYHVGLGLSIVKKIVSLHGGSVAIHDKKDHEFEIEILLPTTFAHSTFNDMKA